MGYYCDGYHFTPVVAYPDFCAVPVTDRIASGYCIREAHSDTIGNAMKFIIKRTQRLYIPFVVWNVSLLCCKNIFIKINIYTNNPSFLEGIPGNAYGLTESLNTQTFFHSLVNILLFQGEQQLEGASWFLRAMFSASVFFILCDYLLKRFLQNISFCCDGFLPLYF